MFSSSVTKTETKEIKHANHRDANLNKSKSRSLPILHKGTPLADPPKMANQKELSQFNVKNLSSEKFPQNYPKSEWKYTCKALSFISLSKGDVTQANF